MKVCPPGFRGGGRRRPGAAGFSLLEVLVALAVFAMAFVLLMSSYVNILNSYERIGHSRDADEDVKFARATLLAQPDLQKAQDGEEFDSTNSRHVRWTATIEPSETMPDLFAVTFNCEITEPGQSEPEKLTQTFMALRPTWSDPADRSKLLQATKDRIAELQGKQPNGFIAGNPAAGGNPNGGFGGGGRGGRGGRGGGGQGGPDGNGGGGRRGPGGGNGGQPGGGQNPGGSNGPAGGFQRGGGNGFGGPGGQGGPGGRGNGGFGGGAGGGPGGTPPPAGNGGQGRGP